MALAECVNGSECGRLCVSNSVLASVYVAVCVHRIGCSRVCVRNCVSVCATQFVFAALCKRLRVRAAVAVVVSVVV